MVVLPDPDSPTRPSVSPRPISNVTPSTARNGGLRCLGRYSITRSLTDSNCSSRTRASDTGGPPSQFGGAHAADRVLGGTAVQVHEGRVRRALIRGQRAALREPAAERP